MTTAAVIALGRPTFDVEFGTAQARTARAVLDGCAASVLGDSTVVIDATEVDGAIEQLIGVKSDVIIVLQATFTDASSVISIAAASDVPIVVWSFPEFRTGRRLRLNSLCGANLAAYSLRRRGHRCAFVHADPTAWDISDRVAAAIAEACRPTASIPPTPISSMPAAVDVGVVRRVERIDERLHRSRIGIIGTPPTGFEPCAGDDDQIASTFGVEVVRLELGDLFAEATAACGSCIDDAVGVCRAPCRSTLHSRRPTWNRARACTAACATSSTTTASQPLPPDAGPNAWPTTAVRCARRTPC